MKHLKVNNETEIAVREPHLTVRDNRLYNTRTNEFEGMDGDRVEFTRKDEQGTWLVTGIVKGYTTEDSIPIRGVETPYKPMEGTKKTVEHISSVTEVLDDEMKAATS